MPGAQFPLSHLIFHFTVEFIHSASNFGAPLLGPAVANVFVESESTRRNLRRKQKAIVALSLFCGLWKLLLCIFLLIPKTIL